MTRDELVEKVARGLEEGAELWARGTGNQAWECPYAVLAGIARRLIVEECARVADEVMEARAKGNEFADPGYIIRTLLPEEPSR